MEKVILLVLFIPVMVYTKIEDSTAFTPIRAEAGDIVITEIMADPLPEVDLPPEEYLEIFNRTGYTCNLENWKLSIDDQNTFFPRAEINPGEYLILCSVSDTGLFSPYGRTVGLKPFPVLANDGRIIVLSDEQGNLINGVEYSSKWYGNNFKSGGGWSLEMTDTNFPFYAEGNWEASTSRKGGTPGSMNSSTRTNPDLEFLGIMNVFPKDSVKIIVEFGEPVIKFADHINIKLDGNNITVVATNDQLYRRFILTTEKQLERGEVYILSLPGSVTDFAGNPPSIGSFCFGIPESPEKRDIVFNELLFNSFPDEPDFLEIINISEKVIDVSELYLASVNDETGITSDARQISGEHKCIIPGSFYVVTTDRKKVISRFPASVPENIFSSSALPSMPDDKGHLLMLNRHLEQIDEVQYNEKMHYSLLSSKEGISLEKIRPDLPSGESNNWHSASESSGWGTPGTVNSVFSGELSGTDQIIFSSPKISPDNDGFEDVLVIDLNGDSRGNAVTVTIFDETGSYVRKIAENFLAGSRASLIWDATADDGSLVNTGIYIVLIELYNDKGKTKSWKKVCAVIR